jgi:hypothetical protein
MMGRRFFLPLLALVAMACFDDEVAGGYDDVENPALSVAVLGPQGQPALSARVELFAQWQNPLQDSQPLLQVDAVQGKAIVRDSQLVVAMRSLHQRGTPWPSADTLAFQLVARLDNQESFESGYLLLRNAQGAYQFYRQQPGGLLSGEKNVLATTSTLSSAIIPFEGTVGEVGQSLGLKSVFVAGSPYRAQVDAQGRFQFARIAGGRFDLKAQASDGKVYGAPNAMQTDAAIPYQAQDWVESDVIWISP